MTFRPDYSRFLCQAYDYQGLPTRMAEYLDSYGERHVVIENRIPLDGGEYEAFYLDWIGAWNAPEPDERCEVPRSLNWRTITPAELRKAADDHAALYNPADLSEA